MPFVAALRHDQMSAPWVIDGPVNGEVFTLYVEKALAPTLAKGEVVILDNKSQGKVGTSSPAPRQRICPSTQISIR
jgi:hypothetical protein